MTELLSSCRNYDNYRRAYGECTDFKIPILGVHLKDLISLYEAMPDYLEEGKVNVHKLLALYNHINELVQLQEVPPPLEANKDLVHLLTVRLREDKLLALPYQISAQWSLTKLCEVDTIITSILRMGILRQKYVTWQRLHVIKWQSLVLDPGGGTPGLCTLNFSKSQS